MEKYTVTYKVEWEDGDTTDSTVVFSTKQKARDFYENMAMALIEDAHSGRAKDFSISRSRNTGF